MRAAFPAKDRQPAALHNRDEANTREVEDVKERIGRITPEAKARVLDDAVALMRKQGHTFDEYDLVKLAAGPLGVVAAIWVAATGDVNGRAPGYEGEKARDLGLKTLEFADEVSVCGDAEAFEQKHAEDSVEVLEFLEYAAERAWELVGRSAARRERDVLRRQRLAVAA